MRASRRKRSRRVALDGVRREDHLHGHRARELRVGGPVDLGHPALSEKRPRAGNGRAISRRTRSRTHLRTHWSDQFIATRRTPRAAIRRRKNRPGRRRRRNARSPPAPGAPRASGGRPLTTRARFVRVTASAGVPSAASRRRLTSTKTVVAPSRATMSISPSGYRTFRSRIRREFRSRRAQAMSSPSRPLFDLSVVLRGDRFCSLRPSSSASCARFRAPSAASSSLPLLRNSPSEDNSPKS